MASFSRLFDMASKALDKTTSSSASSSQSGGRDWRAMVRDVAGAVAGDTRDGSRPTPTDSRTPSMPSAAYTSAVPPVGLTPPASAGTRSTAPDASDRAAIARYEYLLQTADPHQVETIHREAFARLTPQQRAQVQEGMRSELRPTEQPRSAEANDLARAAARSEAMRPGMMAGLLARVGRRGSGAGAGAGAGAGVARGAALVGAGGILGAVAGGAVLSAVAAPLLAQAAGMGIDFDAIASGLDLEAIAGGVELGGAEEFISGAGDAVSGIGEQLSNFEIPGLGDLFGR